MLPRFAHRSRPPHDGPAYAWGQAHHRLCRYALLRRVVCADHPLSPVPHAGINSVHGGPANRAASGHNKGRVGDAKSVTQRALSVTHRSASLCRTVRVLALSVRGDAHADRMVVQLCDLVFGQRVHQRVLRHELHVAHAALAALSPAGVRESWVGGFPQRVKDPLAPNTSLTTRLWTG